MGKILVQIPKPLDEKLVVDVVIYADGTAQVQNQDRFKDIMDQRTAHFQTLEKVDEAIEKVLADPAAEHPTASVVARLKAVLEDEQKKADTDNKAVIQGNGSPGEVQLESQIRNFTRLVNRNQEAPLAEMLEHNKTELAKLAPHVHITKIQ
jgi:type IV pilus biogenesis protein CpaD/CtpE